MGGRLVVRGDGRDTFNADRDDNDVIRRYDDSVIRHRRSRLRLNTAVGHRILP